MFNFMLLSVLIGITNFIVKALIKKRQAIFSPIRRFRFVSNTHKWLEFILIPLALVFFILALFTVEFLFFYLFIASAAIVFTYRALVEYKYERQEKAYMLSLVDLGSFGF